MRNYTDDRQKETLSGELVRNDAQAVSHARALFRAMVLTGLRAPA